MTMIDNIATRIGTFVANRVSRIASRIGFSPVRFIGNAIYMALYVLLNGWALSTLWEWFVVSALSVPPLSVLNAFGIYCVTAFVRGYTSDTVGSTKERIAHNIVQLLRPAIYVGIAYIVKQFV